MSIKYTPHVQSQERHGAEQHHAAMVSTRAVLSRYIGGDATLLAQVKQAQYYDTTRELTRGDALNRIADARSKYEQLPDAVRARFGSMQQMIAFLNNPANEVEARRLGLLNPKKEPEKPTKSEELLGRIADKLAPTEEPKK